MRELRFTIALMLDSKCKLEVVVMALTKQKYHFHDVGMAHFNDCEDIAIIKKQNCGSWRRK